MAHCVGSKSSTPPLLRKQHELDSADSRDLAGTPQSHYDRVCTKRKSLARAALPVLVLSSFSECVPNFL